jgi:hypothetical protein
MQLVELKDPSPACPGGAERQRPTRAYANPTLIYEEPLPKALRSTFLHPRSVPPNLCQCWGLHQAVGVDRGFWEHQRSAAAQARSLTRAPYYVTDCVVVVPGTWPTLFSGFALSRRTHG